MPQGTEMWAEGEGVGSGWMQASGGTFWTRQLACGGGTDSGRGAPGEGGEDGEGREGGAGTCLLVKRRVLAAIRAHVAGMLEALGSHPFMTKYNRQQPAEWTSRQLRSASKTPEV